MISLLPTFHDDQGNEYELCLPDTAGAAIGAGKFNPTLTIAPQVRLIRRKPNRPRTKEPLTDMLTFGTHTDDRGIDHRAAENPQVGLILPVTARCTKTAPVAEQQATDVPAPDNGDNQSAA